MLRFAGTSGFMHVHECVDLGVPSPVLSMFRSCVPVSSDTVVEPKSFAMELLIKCLSISELMC